MGSFLSYGPTRPKPKKLEYNIFKDTRLELLSTTVLPPVLNMIIYGYAFENKGLLLFNTNAKSNDSILKNITWFDGSKWNFMPPHSILNNMTNCLICSIKDHIILIGGHETTKSKNNENKITPPNQQIMYKYNYLDSKFTELAEIPGSTNNYEASCVNFGSYLFVFMKDQYLQSTLNNIVYRYDILKNTWDTDYEFKNVKTESINGPPITKFVTGNKLFIYDEFTYNPDNHFSLYCYENFKLYKINTKNLKDATTSHYFTNFKNQLCRVDYIRKIDPNDYYNIVFYEVKSIENGTSDCRELIETKRELVKGRYITDTYWGLNWDNDCYIEDTGSFSGIILTDLNSGSTYNITDPPPKSPDILQCGYMLLK